MKIITGSCNMKKAFSLLGKSRRRFKSIRNK